MTSGSRKLLLACDCLTFAHLLDTDDAFFGLMCCLNDCSDMKAVKAKLWLSLLEANRANAGTLLRHCGCRSHGPFSSFEVNTSTTLGRLH
jgi:hypothetical protein